jgi:hypothetical protein
MNKINKNNKKMNEILKFHQILNLMNKTINNKIMKLLSIKIKINRDYNKFKKFQK